MILVAWTGLGDTADKGRGHTELRGRTMADLGIDEVPDPPFTNDEMQSIGRAAKFEALRCLTRRKRP